MTSTDRPKTYTLRSDVSLRRRLRKSRPTAVTSAAAYDALRHMLEPNLAAPSAGAAPTAFEAAVADAGAIVDGLRAQIGLPRWFPGVVALALTAALCVAVAPSLLPSRPPCAVHPVVGRVVAGKVAPAGALLVFHPIDRDLPDQVLPRATVGTDGTFAVSTFSPSDGAPAAEYVVTIQWFRVSRDGASGPNVLPPQYAAPDSSPLRVAIHAGRNELESFVIPR
jgi:hypothetical protein